MQAIVVRFSTSCSAEGKIQKSLERHMASLIDQRMIFYIVHIRNDNSKLFMFVAS